ncbi:MAG: TetR/AcrR family transcriptional regulator [Lachnospiraceae bacterium]|nr:TetR/AcrR family transcriptional regulator [Lachnospiraceae bacterium]
MGYDYDQTHDRILKSAKDHFTEKGFSGASIRQICKDAGVTNGAFYAHFDSKEDLFSKLVEPVLSEMQNLYNDESQSYMEIHSANDIKNIMRQSFASNRLFIHYVYENADIFKLLIKSGSGTEFEDFVGKFAKEEAVNTEKFLEKCSQFIGNRSKLSKGLAKRISALIVSALFDGLLEDKTEAEAIREADLASEFCLAGLEHFLGI